MSEPKKNAQDNTMKHTVIDTLKTDVVKNVQADTININKDNIIIKEISLITLELLVDKSKIEFDKWIIENNYIYDEVKVYDNFDVIYYKKENENFIGLRVDKDDSSNGSLLYETKSDSEFINLRNQCVKEGYQNFTTENNKDGGIHETFDTYKNDFYEISFISSNSINHLGYSIGISKVKN